MPHSASSRSPSHFVEHPAPTPLFHPKPVSFTRPPLVTSYSSPLLSTNPASPMSPSTTAGVLGSSSASCSPSPPSSHMMKPSHSLSSKHGRPKVPIKKTSSTTTNKVKNVQVSLEVKVERSRGFHAFFVPLARSMPPAPPSSPVFGQSANSAANDNDDHDGDGCDKASSEERWVEDVGHQRMDIDA